MTRTDPATTMKRLRDELASEPLAIDLESGERRGVIGALAGLTAYTYGLGHSEIRLGAALRAAAMDAR